MSIQSFTRAGAAALVIAVMASASACDLVPFNQRVPVPSQPPGPVISQLSGTQAPDGGLVFTVVAADRDKKPLRFTWTASHGTLSSTSGTTVTWKPLKADGTPEPAGMTQIRVTATNGRETESLGQLVRMDGAGGAAVYVPDNIPAAPTPKPSPSPSGSAAPGGTGSPVACSVGKASPTIAAAGARRSSSRPSRTGSPSACRAPRRSTPGCSRSWSRPAARPRPSKAASRSRTP
jgi:hypothetical protein